MVPNLQPLLIREPNVEVLKKPEKWPFSEGFRFTRRACFRMIVTVREHRPDLAVCGWSSVLLVAVCGGVIVAKTVTTEEEV